MTGSPTRSADAFSPLSLLIAVGLIVGLLAWLRPGVEPAQASVAPAAPTRLVVPSLDLRAAVVPIEVDAQGVLFPPDDVAEVGWWKRSARPGSDRGPTVLTGHTVSDGGGVMDRLGELRRGDRVVVRTPEGRIAYETADVRVYSRSELASAKDELFSRRGESRLVLITCTDWDGEDYLSNIVVLATPA